MSKRYPMNDWIVIYKSSEVYQVELLKQLLHQANIPAVIVNKSDSAYRMLGQAWLYVPQQLQQEAIKTIKTNASTLHFDLQFSLN